MDRIMVGDIVKVNPNNAGHNYPSYLEWFRFYNVEDNGFTSLQEHINIFDEDYVVRWIAPHLYYSEMIYAIEGIDTGNVFLVDRDVIAGYYHTTNSTDSHLETNQIRLVQEIVQLRSKIDSLKEELLAFEEETKRKKPKTELKDVLSPMPRLENGMFGMVTRHCNGGDEYEYFVVIKEQDKRFRLIYEGGGFDIVGADFCNEDVDFSLDGVTSDGEAEIVCLMRARDFNQAERYLAFDGSVEVIWEKYSQEPSIYSQRLPIQFSRKHEGD